MELRERVLADVDAGIPVAPVARKYSITRPPIYDWLALRQQTGSLEPRPGTCGPTLKRDEYREQIEGAVAAEPSLTLVDLKAQLELPGCLGTLWNALDNWDLSLKKSLFAAEQLRADVQKQRKSGVSWTRPLLRSGRRHKLVFIDESAITTSLVRLYVWRPRGERIKDY